MKLIAVSETGRDEMYGKMWWSVSEKKIYLSTLFLGMGCFKASPPADLRRIAAEWYGLKYGRVAAVPLEQTVFLRE